MTAKNGRPYRLISSDSHLTEPGDLWVKRVPGALRDRAPRIVSLDHGDGWVVEGIAEPFSFGLTSCAGLPPEEMRAWIRFDEMRKGGWDPASRVQEMDRDNVDGEVLFPTPRLQIALVANQDEAWHVAMLRAYNDWLSEYVAYTPDRFCGLALLPNRGGAKAAVAELDRVVGRPGMRGAMIGCWPNGTLTLQPEDDLLWAALVERGIPLTIHVSLAQALPPIVTKMKLPGYGRFFDAPNRMIEMVFSGMFDRFPTLDVFFAEVDFGWVPYVVEQIENNYRRLERTSNFGLKKSPRDYIERHFHFGYMTDTFGLQNRHHVGAERILWSSDYPHISADWPFSWRTIQSSLSGVSQAERELILHGNAERLFGFA